MLLSMFWGPTSCCRGLVCSLYLWYFLTFAYHVAIQCPNLWIIPNYKSTRLIGSPWESLSVELGSTWRVQLINYRIGWTYFISHDLRLDICQFLLTKQISASQTTRFNTFRQRLRCCLFIFFCFSYFCVFCVKSCSVMEYICPILFR